MKLSELFNNLAEAKKQLDIAEQEHQKAIAELNAAENAIFNCEQAMDILNNQSVSTFDKVIQLNPQAEKLEVDDVVSSFSLDAELDGDSNE